MTGRKARAPGPRGGPGGEGWLGARGEASVRKGTNGGRGFESPRVQQPPLLPFSATCRLAAGWIEGLASIRCPPQALRHGTSSPQKWGAKNKEEVSNSGPARRQAETPAARDDKGKLLYINKVRGPDELPTCDHKSATVRRRSAGAGDGCVWLSMQADERRRPQRPFRQPVCELVATFPKGEEKKR